MSSSSPASAELKSKLVEFYTHMLKLKEERPDFFQKFLNAPGVDFAQNVQANIAKVNLFSGKLADPALGAAPKGVFKIQLGKVITELAADVEQYKQTVSALQPESRENPESLCNAISDGLQKLREAHAIPQARAGVAPQPVMPGKRS
jgi:hypothetical protein